MQIPILAGREIDECDKPGSPLVAVVNENLLKTLRVRIRSEDGLDSGMATRTISKSSVSQGTQVYNQSQPKSEPPNVLRIAQDCSGGLGAPHAQLNFRNARSAVIRRQCAHGGSPVVEILFLELESRCLLHA